MRKLFALLLILSVFFLAGCETNFTFAKKCRDAGGIYVDGEYSDNVCLKPEAVIEIE